MSRITLEDLRSGRAALRALCAPAFVGAEDLVRRKPRSEAEAAFLREIGTPERLIGPVER